MLPRPIKVNVYNEPYTGANLPESVFRKGKIVAFQVLDDDLGAVFITDEGRMHLARISFIQVTDPGYLKPNKRKSRVPEV